MDTIENNKLVAEFMGLDSFKDSLASLNQGKINIDIDVYEQAQYHTSWDWLKPVINKINSINKVELGDLVATDELIGNIHRDDRLCNLIQTHEAVVEFIKWYNENKED